MNQPYAHEVNQLRTPPMSIEAEQAVLGGLLLPYSDAFELVADIISEDDFYRRDHQLIFRAIAQLAEKHRPYDAVTAMDWFDANGLSEQVGGGGYLIELASTTPSAANIAAYAKIVKDKALLRKLIDVGTDLVNQGFAPEGRDTTDMLDAAESAVMAISGAKVQEVEDGDTGLRATLAELSRRRKLDPNQLLGVTTSLDLLDANTHGLQPTDLIILAARPSMGKSVLALQIRRAAAMNGMRPYTIELEMNREACYMRDIAATGHVNYDVVQRTAKASEQEMEAMRRAVIRLRGMQWWLDCSPGLSIDSIIARIRRMKKQHNIGIAIIDYLQYIDMSRQLRSGLNVTNSIQEITRRLKACAKELHIPIVLLSQLNRGNEARKDKRPMMSDLRESGAIEQDADMIMFIHREGYYEKEWPRDDPRQKLAEIIVAKSRNGITGTVPVQWEGRYQQFNNLAYDDPANLYNPQQTSSKGGFESARNHGLVTIPVSMVNQEDED